MPVNEYCVSAICASPFAKDQEGRMRVKVFLRPAIGTALFLLVPLAAMQFTHEVNWGPGDFAIMAVLLFASGLAYELIASRARSPAHRIVAGLAVGAVFIAIWAELAVGAVSKALGRL
jgi:hypothetical protein